jgi:cell wall-associated NlpC family hydrolase
VALSATPVLNSPDFKAVLKVGDGQILKTDRCGQVHELEFIALPGSVFKIVRKLCSGTAEIFQVETDEYTAPAHVRLYVDPRFLKLVSVAPEARRRVLPSREDILAELRKAVGNAYVWGGNIPAGVPELAAWYHLRTTDTSAKILGGLDCSGLLYNATDGWTPRNTAQLISIGTSVAIAGKQSIAIADMLQPLDLIVWNGHVIIVLDRQMAIESRLECGKPGNGGVMLSKLSQRLAGIMRTRRPANAWIGEKKRQDIFVVRRWYDQYQR